MTQRIILKFHFINISWRGLLFYYLLTFLRLSNYLVPVCWDSVFLIFSFLFLLHRNVSVALFLAGSFIFFKDISLFVLKKSIHSKQKVLGLVAQHITGLLVFQPMHRLSYRVLMILFSCDWSWVIVIFWIVMSSLNRNWHTDLNKLMVSSKLFDFIISH